MRLLMDRKTYKKIKKTSDKFGIHESNVNQLIIRICDKLKEQKKDLLKEFKKIIKKFHKILEKNFEERDYIESNALKEIHDIYRDVINNKV